MNERTPLLDHNSLNGENGFENSIRPRKLDQYIGQKQVTNQMNIFIQAAQNRNEALDHVLISAPPGLGKTTLAYIVAAEMGVSLHKSSGPILEKAGDLAAILTNLHEFDVLFIDEIHRLSPAIEEVLYPAMEDFQLDIIIGEGPAARSINIDLSPFTLVGATTRTGLLTSPLRDRFGIVQRLEFYGQDSLQEIVKRTASILGVEIDAEGALEIAIRSRGTPRIANRLLRRVRDYVEVKLNGKITIKTAKEALDMLDVDKRGLDIMDRKVLLSIIEKFSGGPVGIESLSVAVHEERGTLEDVIEPYLIQNGFMKRSARGRCVTEHAYEHLGIPVNRQHLEESLIIPDK